MSAVEVSAHMSRPLFPGGAGAAHVLVLSKAIVRGETAGQLRDRSLAGWLPGRTQDATKSALSNTPNSVEKRSLF